MKSTITTLIFIGAAFASGAVFAQSADDRKWVNQCLSDNSDAKVAASVVRAYCVCMNNKMSDNETRSISEWEKANPQSRAACDRESGWR